MALSRIWKVGIIILSLLNYADSDLVLINTHNANVFASSVAIGSKPQYAVDSDFDGPSCYHASASDNNGYHWLTVDLGSVMTNISVIRIYLADESNDVDLSEIEVFIAQRIHSAIFYRTDQPEVERRLPWSLYEFCNKSVHNQQTGKEAVVNCGLSKHGRWVLLRRRHKPLVICLLAIYRDSDSNQCFQTVTEVDPLHKMHGSQFRLERHISMTQCRQSCMDTSICQAIDYTKHSRHTGSCSLLKEFERNSTKSQDPVDICSAGRRCHVEENVCHRGHVLSLKPFSAGVSGSMNLSWAIDRPSVLNNVTLQVQHLYAVQLNGHMGCFAEDCGLIVVTIVDTAGEEIHCGTIDTTLVSVLDQFTIYCNNQTSPAPTSHITLKSVDRNLIARPNNDSNIPALQLEGGHVRFLDITKPEAVIPDQPVLPNDVYLNNPPPLEPEVELPIVSDIFTHSTTTIEPDVATGRILDERPIESEIILNSNTTIDPQVATEKDLDGMPIASDRFMNVHTSLELEASTENDLHQKPTTSNVYFNSSFPVEAQAVSEENLDQTSIANDRLLYSHATRQPLADSANDFHKVLIESNLSGTSQSASETYLHTTATDLDPETEELNGTIENPLNFSIAEQNSYGDVVLPSSHNSTKIMLGVEKKQTLNLNTAGLNEFKHLHLILIVTIISFILLIAIVIIIACVCSKSNRQNVEK